MSFFCILIWLLLKKDAVNCQFIKTISSTDLPEINTSSGTDFEKIVLCYGKGGNSVRSTSMKFFCCDVFYKAYFQTWFLQMNFLSDMLKTLKVWHCPQYKKECANPTFDFTDFTKLVYLHICNYTAFIQNCLPTVKQYLYKKQSIENPFKDNLEIKHTKWTNIAKTSKRNTTTTVADWMQLKNLLEPCVSIIRAPPCVQVALLDSSKENSSYFEIHQFRVPFCKLPWCGVHEETVRRHHISLWNCMSSSCHRGAIVSFCLIALLSVLITWTNGTVVVVFLRDRDLRDSQGIYKLSMAIADTMVGSFVLPSFVITINRIVFWPQLSSDDSSQNVFNLVLKSLGNSSFIKFINTKELFYKNVFTSPAITQEYANSVGFISTIVFGASIYSLTVASIDRLSLLVSPLKYNASLAKKRAIHATFSVWVAAVIFSSLPFLFWQHLRFGILGSGLITLTGKGSTYVYSLSLLLPIFTLWITTIMTGYYLYKHARQREVQSFEYEHRMTRTFILMVIIFSLNLIPAVLSAFRSILYPTKTSILLPISFDVTASFYSFSYDFISIIVLVCNSCWNFFIYNSRNDGFRKGTKRLYKDLILLLTVSMKRPSRRK